MLDEVKERGIPIVHLSAGDEIKLPRCSLTTVWPLLGGAPPGQDANRYSLCLLWELDGVRLLSCADISGEYEAYAARGADILKVSHHGSKPSTGKDFLETVSPQTTLITTSRTSTRLPSPDTVRRIRDSGAAIYETGKAGAVTVIMKDGRASVTTFLNNEEQP